jgi:hypothetical protein
LQHTALSIKKLFVVQKQLFVNINLDESKASDFEVIEKDGRINTNTRFESKTEEIIINSPHDKLCHFIIVVFYDDNKIMYKHKIEKVLFVGKKLLAVKWI